MNRYQYIAEQFNIAINTTSIQHTKLIRYTIRYRTPVILELIKEIYNNNYSKSFGEDLNNTMFVDDRTRDMIFLLLNEEKIKKNKKPEGEDGELKSRGVPADAFDTDNEDDEDEGDIDLYNAQLSNKEGVIDEIEIVRENGDIETIQIIQEAVDEDENKNIKQTKEE